MRWFPYVNGPEAGTVARSQVLIEGLDGVRPGQLAVLLVHVVGAGPRIVADPDAEVLDLERPLLGDLRRVLNQTARSIPKDSSTYHPDADDLARRLLDLLQTAQKVPVPRLGDRLVGSEDRHAVEAGGRVRLGGQMPPDDIVFLKATYRQ